MLDLHMHSVYSEDGEFAPAELVRRCKAAGVDFMAVTDHNSMRAEAEAAAAAKAEGIAFLRGVELDCTYKGVNLHVLGYGVKNDSGDFTALDEEMNRKYRETARASLQKTCELGFHVTEDEMRAFMEGSMWPDRWTGERFGELLLQKPEYREAALLAPYRPGGARSDNPCVNFYLDFYSQGKSAYVEIAFPDLADVLALVHRNGGIAVLAHPGNNLKGRDELFEEIMAMDIAGIEAFCSYHSPEQAEFYDCRSRALGKFSTIGSDYHGRLKPAIELGRVAFPAGVDRAEVEAEARRNLERYLE